MPAPNKRAAIMHEMYFVLFELILVFIVFMALLSFVDYTKNNSYFERNFYARDIALVLDAVQASPEDVSFTYSAGLSEHEYLVEFHDGAVKVGDVGYPYFASFWYMANPKKPVGNVKLEKPKSIHILNTPSGLSVSKKALTIGSYAHVTEAEINEPKESQIIMFTAEKPELYDVAKTFKSMFEQQFHSVLLVNNTENLKYSDVYLTLTAANDGFNDIIIYYDADTSPKTKRLADILANSFASEPEITSIVTSVSTAPYKGTLMKDRLHLVIQLGSLSQPNNKNLRYRSAELTRALYEGMSAYYVGSTTEVQSVEVYPESGRQGTRFLIRATIDDARFVNTVHAIVVNSEGEVQQDVLIMDNGINGDDIKNDGIYANACVNCMQLQEGEYWVDIYIDYKDGSTSLVKKASMFRVEK